MTTKRQISEEEYSEFQALKANAFKQTVQPVIDKLPTLSEKAKKRLITELEFSTELQGGQFVPVKDGAPVLDAHGWPLTLQDHITTLAQELTEAPESTGVQKPRNDDECFQMMKAAKTEAERLAIHKSYRE